MLVRLIYKSEVFGIQTSQDIAGIAEKAADNNAKEAITGILFYNSKQFIQVLEGERSKVGNLFKIIAQDPRHESIELLQFIECDQRYFSRWHMRYIGEGVLTSELVLKYSPSPELDLDRMSGSSIFNFLCELSQADFLNT